jgi:hypothetical protein
MPVFKRKAVLVLLFVLFLLPPVALSAAGEREIALGDVFPPACADCHGPDPAYPVLGTTASYDYSGHKNLGNASYANGSGCQICHTHEGFVDFVDSGPPESDDFVANPSAVSCFTCHDSHATGDFALRTAASVIISTGDVFDGGDGNLCANCHQSRRDVSTQVTEMEAASVRSHWGAHHGPQADVVLGVNGFEFPGKSYSSSVHQRVIQDSCVECHMSLPEGRYSLSPAVGGHSFNVLGEVHEDEKANLSGCVSCHAEIGQVSGEEVFDIAAKADYDNDGTVEPLQTEVQGLLDFFVNENGTGVLQNTNPPMFKKDAHASFHDLGSGWAGSRNGSWTETEIGVLWNYKLIIEDRSLGVHNATYIIQLLYDSLEALNPSLDTSSRRPR